MATALPELGAKRYGFGTYVAANYDELIDHPVEMGDFALGTFKAHGIPHDIVITGRVPNLDMARLQADLKALCETQIAFFEPRTKRAPMDRYVFMTMAVGDGYGGLEHRASTALICNRADLPTTAAPKSREPSEGYIKFLGLCSHEYFHTWNVKRIKPAAFAPYDLQAETYTPLLWLFEGFTSYYDDLLLLRSGLISEAAYLKLLGKTDRRRPARQRPHQAERGRFELRRLEQVLPPGRKRAERDRQLLRQGFADRAGVRPDHPRQDRAARSRSTT